MPPTPRPTILIIDDETDVHYSFRRLLEKDPLDILTADNGDDGVALVRKHQPDLVVMDIRMGKDNGLDVLARIREIDPQQIVIMMTAYGTSQTAIQAMTLGAFDYILKPFDIPHLRDLLHRALDASRAMREKIALPESLPSDDVHTSVDDTSSTPAGIIGQSSAMQEVYKLVGQVARSEATVLIHGESGTGKELIARAIYSNSSRSRKTYIAINCAAIPENLLESELFGHEKGAFTGASTQRIGKFEQCNGGTLFLDEIGDMPLPLQTKLLRVLQDGEVHRIGGDTPIRTDVRIIAATNRDLWQAVKRKEFREDLYYRLNVVTIVLPPLRQRPSDIPPLVQHFIRKWAPSNSTASGPVTASPDVLKTLADYPWPGNVRELENTIQRALVLASSGTITLADLPAEVRSPSQPSQPSQPLPPHSPQPSPPSQQLSPHSQRGSAPAAPSTSSPQNGGGAMLSPTQADLEAAIALIFEHAAAHPDFAILPALEREMILRALRRTHSNQVQTARLLGITRATLRKRIEKFGLTL